MSTARQRSVKGITVSSPAKANYHLQSLTRGVQVLRHLASESEPVPFQALHRATGVSKPTLVRLLAVLTDLGCTVRVDDRPAYLLGPTMVEIAAGLEGRLGPEELARPVLHDLMVTLGHTVNMGVISAEQVLHVSVILANRPVRYTAKSGTRDELWCTGLGKMLLAMLPGEERDAILERADLQRRTATTLHTRDLLCADLEATRVRGWAHDDQEGADGLRCFAVPLFDGDECVGAISVSGPAAELPISASKHVTPELMLAANRLTESAPLLSGLRALSRGH